VQSPAEELHEVLPMAIDRLSQLDCIIIEGNSAIEFLKPDVVIFLLGATAKRIKPSARAVFKHADIIVCNDVPAAAGLLKNRKPQPQIFSLSSLNIRELIIYMEAVIQKKEIARHLKANASLNEISCSLARKIAEDLGVTYSDIGKAADEIEIKIRNCELGCF
jgi:LAO/AO transport system kinase